VAALAIDPLGNGSAKEQLTPAGHMARFDFRVGVVAKKTLLVDLSPKVWMAPAVIAGIHGPKSAVFRIPGYGGFD